MKKILSLLMGVVLACQVALPVFAEAGTTAQTTATDTTAQEGQTTGDTTQSGETGTTGESTASGSTEVTALPTITSDSYIVMNADTGQVLISKNPDKKQYPSSIVKILTTALALEYVDSEGEYTVTTEDVFPSYPESYRFSDGTYVAITQDETVKVLDLIYGTIMQSADDTANALADCAAKAANRSVTLSDGSTSYTAGFVEMMNEKAKSLGCINSNFMNPHGLYNENQYTTAYDMALITRYALQTTNFLQYFSQTEYSMQPTNKQSLPRNWKRSREGMMLVGNDSYYEGTIGVELGNDTQSNHTAVSVVERDGIRLICVALNCTGSNSYVIQNDMINLLDYCYNNFIPVTYTAEELAPEGFKTPVYDQRGEESQMIGTATFSTSGDFTVLIHKNFSKEDVSVSADIPGRYYQNEEMPSTLTFSMNSSTAQDASQYMVPTMAALKLQVNVVTFSEIEAQKKAERQALFNKIFNIVKIVFFIFLGLVILLLIIRIRNKRKYKKRIARKKAAQARRRQLQQGSSPQRREQPRSTTKRKR